MQPSPCSSLFNGPVCHFQHLVCILGGLVGFFVKHVFCCCGHHIFKKCKWWGMPACNLQLAWPQTSDEQANNVLGMPWLPLLGQQPPFASKEVPVSSGLGAPQSRLFSIWKTCPPWLTAVWPIGGLWWAACTNWPCAATCGHCSKCNVPLALHGHTGPRLPHGHLWLLHTAQVQ